MKSKIDIFFCLLMALLFCIILKCFWTCLVGKGLHQYRGKGGLGIPTNIVGKGLWCKNTREMNKSEVSHQYRGNFQPIWWERVLGGIPTNIMGKGVGVRIKGLWGGSSGSSGLQFCLDEV